MYRYLLKIWRYLALTTGVQVKVLRMLNDKFLIGVTGVIFNENHEVLLVKHSYRRVRWSLPGGYLQSSEHPKKGLQREIYEETNLKVFIEKIVKTSHDENSARLDLCYVGSFKSGTFKKSHEVTDFGFYSRNKLPKLITDQYEQIDLAYEQYKRLHTLPLFKKITNLFK
jgi:8-oxo-dGTP diphosphatase